MINPSILFLYIKGPYLDVLCLKGIVKPLNTEDWPQVYKTFSMLYSAEHEIFPVNKFQITNSCKFLLAKHSWAWNFLFIYENANCRHFHIYKQRNFMLSSAEHEISLLINMLYSAEHEIFSVNKSQITNSCKFLLAKHSRAWNFLFL